MSDEFGHNFSEFATAGWCMRVEPLRAAGEEEGAKQAAVDGPLVICSILLFWDNTCKAASISTIPSTAARTSCKVLHSLQQRDPSPMEAPHAFRRPCSCS